MGRELRRKQAKRDGKSLEKEEIIDEKQIQKLIINIIIIVISIGIIYLLSALFVTKELDWFSKKEEAPVSTVTNSILASAIFKQSEEEYYVYLYDFDEENAVITNVIGDSLQGLKVYKVDTSSAMNSKYISDTSNKKATNLNDLKVVVPTIIKVAGDKITEYYEKDEIEKKFIN